MKSARSLLGISGFGCGAVRASPERRSNKVREPGSLGSVLPRQGWVHRLIAARGLDPYREGPVPWRGHCRRDSADHSRGRRTDQAREWWRRRVRTWRSRHCPSGHRLPRGPGSDATIASGSRVRAILPTTLARVWLSRGHHHRTVRRRRHRRYRHPSGQRARQFQGPLPVQEVRGVGRAKSRARFSRRNDRPRRQGNNHHHRGVHVRGTQGGRSRWSTTDRIGRWRETREHA
jgi:hypothetical protein